ncbi:MAG: DUF4127 family protein [Ornithinimicrobium sp.]
MVPLDERPVCRELPAQIAALAGVITQVPPDGLAPRQRVAGDVAGTRAWLHDRAGEGSGIPPIGVVVSLEGLALGGLIPSRIGSEPLDEVLGHFDRLEKLSAPIYASVVVPRCPDTDDAAEEPDYWARHGRALHTLARTVATGREDLLRPIREAVPSAYRQDWQRRRFRQHAMALRAVEVTARGRFEALLIGVDDAAPGGLSALHASQLQSAASLLDVSERVAIRPGNDESGAVLVARAIAAYQGYAPRIGIVSGHDDLDLVPTYDHEPLSASIPAHIWACGGVPVVYHGPEHTEVDAVLVVHGPQGEGDWALSPPMHSSADRAATTVSVAQAAIEAGMPTAVADVAHPNGADPALVEELLRQEVAGELSGYAAWNTAGNAIGTACAAIVATVIGRNSGHADHRAAQDLVAHRIVEDWGWMTSVRPWLRGRTGADPGVHDEVAPDHPLLSEAGERLAALISHQLWLNRWTLDADQIALPWHRSFEVSFSLNRRST